MTTGAGSPRQGKGLLFVVSAPSGAGKTTLCREVVNQLPGLRHSVSYTTRKPRPGEVDGRDYYFLDEGGFRKKAERGEFIEWAEVHGHLYGTSWDQLLLHSEQGVDLILDIDAQGAMQLKKKEVEGVFIYILPPSFDVLKARLMERRSDSPEEINRRLRKAREEIWSYREYSYMIINDDVKRALSELQAVIVAERIRMKRMNFMWIEETFIKNKEVF
ncbi:MAG: guanylate kinase [Nitrospirae bacterium]|nr:guanylate kinase [Nitrospirota bacterium]